MAVVRHLGFSNFHIRPSFLSDFASSHKISQKSEKPLPSYGQKRFPIWRPSAILKLKIRTSMITMFVVTIWFDVPIFVIIGSFFTALSRHYNDFHINGSPPSRIHDDVIILHPVIEFYCPNIVLNFHVDSFGSFRTSLTYAHLATDKQTDRQTHWWILSAPSQYVVRGFIVTDVPVGLSRAFLYSCSSLGWPAGWPDLYLEGGGQEFLIA